MPNFLNSVGDALENIDIVDEQGKLTGRSASREEIHRKGLWHRTVHVWLINDMQEVLLQKRAMNKESHPGLWDISCAGHISAGETSIEAVLKELEEELGIVAGTEDLEFLFSQKTCFTQKNGTYIDNEVHDTYLFLKKIPACEIKIQLEEIERVQYVPFETFKKMVKEKNSELVQHTEEYGRLIDIIESRKKRGDA